MSARLDELERLEKRGTPGPWYQATDDGKPESVVLYDDSCLLECHDGPHDAEFVAALRNAAPALLAIARAAHDVAECLCLPGEPEAYATLGERLRSALAALDQVEEAGGSKCSR